MAQEDEEKVVCLVYFTSNACGDECRFTDTFMNGLMREYSGTLMSIIYSVDASQQNSVVFDAYKYTYNLPPDAPIVLFGKNDYLHGKNDIYERTEEKIFNFLTENGTNCPLDSGFIPPSQISPGSLPGQAQILTGLPDAGEKAGGTKEGSGELPDDDDEDAAPGNGSALDILALNEPMKESVISLAIIGAVLIVLAVIIIYIWSKNQESI